MGGAGGGGGGGESFDLLHLFRFFPVSISFFSSLYSSSSFYQIICLNRLYSFYHYREEHAHG